MKLLDDLDLRGRVALDIGAHSGNWAANLAARVGDDGTVVAYEALPHYGRALRMALRILRLRNVRVRDVAVGDTERTINLRWRTDADEPLTGKTHIDPDAVSSAGVVQVQMVSLDHDLRACGLRPGDVGFIKIDVEGAELEVLRGASNLLRVGRPVVYLETEPEWINRFGHSVRDVFDEMALYGYSPFLASADGAVPTNVDSYLSQYVSRRTFNNVLFLPEQLHRS
ncbi:FkbM family methyltransferase [Mycolicibacterium iranicum]|uniref:FkbM family methyltransferase n=1 Tax=Mycolicibacterium iranicum TaxID=912594 RepID=A0A839Q5S3_MYCIR|nr:FkbM family methyltransferase [Mycolicibacterium iranicum]MBB2991279.1 FkbM family methyltransferase [Mycolicibacterium iranicum]